MGGVLVHHSAMSFKGSVAYAFEAKTLILKASVRVAKAECSFTELRMWVTRAKKEARKA